MADNQQKKITELRQIRKRADTELEAKWERIAQIAEEARAFANYCITRAKRSESSASSSSINSFNKNK